MKGNTKEKSSDKILQTIILNPGIHLREIYRKIKLSEGTIKYHLRKLEKSGLIIKKKKNRYSRYYHYAVSKNHEQNILALLRSETPRNILLYLFVKTYASQIELSKFLKKDPKSIEEHIKNLKGLEVIEPVPFDKVDSNLIRGLEVIKRKPIGREILYKLKEPHLIYQQLLFYNIRSIENGTTKDIIDFFKVLILEEDKKLELENEIDIDKLIKTLFDYFHPPYTQ